MRYLVKNKIIIIVSKFNSDITEQLQRRAIARLHDRGFENNQYQVLSVPGAVEIPFAAQCCAKAGARAIITFGLVMRGETGHYDFVCKQVSDGCQRVMLDHHIPVVFGVLTTDTKQQAQNRVDGTVYDVGADSVDTMLAMLSLADSI